MAGTSRLFVAVWPPGEVLEVLSGLDRPPVEGLRWTAPEQWHVTLQFLGAVPAARVVDVAAALAGVEVPPTAVELGPRVERFGSRVLHVPVAGLEPLAAAVVRATTAAGLEPPEGAFAGHLTLARVSRGRRVDLGRFTGTQLAAAWTVTEITLVASHIGSAGARYQVVARTRAGRPPPADL